MQIPADNVMHRSIPEPKEQAMSTPEDEPQNPPTPPVNPAPPKYGQLDPQGQNTPPPSPYGQAPQQNPYGQDPNPYGQPPQQNPYGQNPNPYGQPQQPQSPYGQQPFGGGFPVPPQGGFPAPQMPTERPKELNIAFWAIIAAGALSVIGAIFGFNETMLRQQLATMPGLEEQMQTTGMTLEDFLGVVRIMVIVFSVISMGLYLLIAFMVRKGSNVARIFATVFAAISIFGLFGGTALGILSILAGITGVVFAWMRPSSAYIAARRAARAAGYR